MESAADSAATRSVRSCAIAPGATAGCADGMRAMAASIDSSRERWSPIEPDADMKSTSGGDGHCRNAYPRDEKRRSADVAAGALDLAR